MDKTLCCPLKLIWMHIGWLRKNDMSVVMYHDLMMDNIDQVTDKRIKVLNDIERDKAQVVRFYKKKVKASLSKLWSKCGKLFYHLG